MKKYIRKGLNKMGLEVSLVSRSPKYVHIDKNTIVSNKIGNYIMLMNYAHIHNAEMLAEQYSKNLPRIVLATVNKYPAAQVIDIGANIGDSVALIKSVVEVPVVCVEGDDFYFEILKKNLQQFKNVTSFKNYLGEVDEKISGKPIQDNGSLKIDVSASTELSVLTFDTIVNQNRDKFGEIKVFKIDTDGFDLKILRGSKETFKKYKPVIFFEYSEKHLRDAGDDGLTIFPFFKELEYQYVVFYDYNGRMIFSTEIVNELQIKQIHAYVSNYSSPLQFIDIAVFHKNDRDIYENVIGEEMKVNLLNANKLIPNR